MARLASVGAAPGPTEPSDCREFSGTGARICSRQLSAIRYDGGRDRGGTGGDDSPAACLLGDRLRWSERVARRLEPQIGAEPAWQHVAPPMAKLLCRRRGCWWSDLESERRLHRSAARRLRRRWGRSRRLAVREGRRSRWRQEKSTNRCQGPPRCGIAQPWEGTPPTGALKPRTSEVETSQSNR